MELTELQIMWQQYDKKLSETTRLNKEILRIMLQRKPEKRLNRIKLRAVLNLVIPIALILLILVPRIVFRSEIDFYAGIFLFGIVFLITYYWAIRYYLLICNIDFSNSITEIRKDINILEKYKIRITKFGYISMPFALTGIFLIAQIPVFSKKSFLPLSLIVTVLIISVYCTFKYSISDRFKKINKEIDEIEHLEKE